MNKKIFGVVKNGKFTAENKNEFVMAFSQFEGKDVEIVIKKRGKNKNRQYRYLYSVVYQCIADASGMSIDEVDYAMKLKFYFEYNRVLKIRMPKKKSTEFFDTGEFTKFIENVRKWAMDFLSVRIPEPNEIEY